MTAKELARLIGRTGWLATEGGKLVVRVSVHDARMNFGVANLLVGRAGEGDSVEGSVWVTRDRVRIEEE